MRRFSTRLTSARMIEILVPPPCRRPDDKQGACGLLEASIGSPPHPPDPLPDFPETAGSQPGGAGGKGESNRRACSNLLSPDPVEVPRRGGGRGSAHGAAQALAGAGGSGLAVPRRRRV